MEITPDITIEDLVREYPKSVSILLKYGIKAMVCGEPIWGTLGEAMDKYKVKDRERLLEELRELQKSGGKGPFLNVG